MKNERESGEKALLYSKRGNVTNEGRTIEKQMFEWLRKTAPNKREGADLWKIHVFLQLFLKPEAF